MEIQFIKYKKENQLILMNEEKHLTQKEIFPRKEISIQNFIFLNQK